MRPAERAPHLEALWDALPLGAAAFDGLGRATRVNRRLRELLGAPSYAGRTLDDLLGGAQGADALRAAADAALRGAHPPTHRLVLSAAGGGSANGPRGPARGPGAVTAELTLVPLPGGGFLATLLDITQAEQRQQELAEDLEEQFRVGNALYEYMLGERDRLEQIADARAHELLRLQEKHARDRRLAAVGQLAAGVMHDVNNCLNPIVAAAHLLTLRADDPAAVCDYARRIAKAAESGAATAARVGRFIRQDPLPGAAEQVVDLSVLADEVVAMTRPVWSMRAAGRVQLVFDCPPGAVVRGVEGELRAALLNLVYNAVDAMPDGGTLSLCAGAGVGGVTVEVRDTGIGMTAEVRERAFEPFFTTKGVAGSGLGLSEVYGIVRRHRGRAEIESAPGRGTTVRLVFPLVAPAGGVAAPPASAPTRRVPKRVLIVEDHVDGREFMRALLASDGHAVDAVGCVRDALARLESPVDVVVTDIGLPDGSGWEVIAAARARWPNVRAGVVTGWEPHSVDTGQAHFTLRKPVRVQDLLAIVAADAAADAPGTA
ncbi:MAG TPA: ATP-binding protein [Gemmatimonadaceae bacterium]|nr:ATP-binding protein [Gemmatimonadaceae bacterium]